MDNLCGMGYGYQWRVRVLRSTLAGYKRVMEKVDRGETKRKREGKTTRLTRRWKKLMGPSTWFKSDKRRNEELTRGEPPKRKRGRYEGSGKSPDVVMFVPATPGGVLRVLGHNPQRHNPQKT